MKKYCYSDGFTHLSNGLNASEIKNDESEHGDLLCVIREDGRRVFCFYSEKGGRPVCRKKI